MWGCSFSHLSETIILIKIISNISLQLKLIRLKEHRSCCRNLLNSSDSCTDPTNTLWMSPLLNLNTLIVRLECLSCTVSCFIILVFFWVWQQTMNSIDHTLKQSLLCLTWWMGNTFLKELKYSTKCLAWWFVILFYI